MANTPCQDSVGSLNRSDWLQRLIHYSV